MNSIWCVVMIIGITILIFINPSSVLPTMLTASEKSVNLCLSLLSIYAVWLGLLKILENTGASRLLGKLLSPLIDFLFGKGLDDYTKSQIAINLSSNILGLGNAATPSAINAMQSLDDKTGRINSKMIMLMLINCISLQLLPTTIIGLRISAKSQNATSIIFPTILTSIITAVVAITFAKLLASLRVKKHAK